MQFSAKKPAFVPKPLSAFTPNRTEFSTPNNPHTNGAPNNNQLNNNIHQYNDYSQHGDAAFTTPIRSSQQIHNVPIQTNGSVPYNHNSGTHNSQPNNQHHNIQHKLHNADNVQHISTDNQQYNHTTDHIQSSVPPTIQHSIQQPHSIYDTFDEAADDLFATIGNGGTTTNALQLQQDASNLHYTDNQSFDQPNHIEYNNLTATQVSEQNTLSANQSTDTQLMQQHDASQADQSYTVPQDTITSLIDPLLLSLQLACMAKQSLADPQAIHALNDETIVICNKDIPSDTFNITVNSIDIVRTMTIYEFDEFVYNVLCTYTVNNIPVKHAVITAPLSDPYIEIMYKYGYKLECYYLYMSMSLDSMCQYLNNTINMQSSLNIQRVTTQQQLHDESTVWPTVFADAGATDEANAITQWYQYINADMLHTGDAINMHKYVGYINDTPVTTGMVYIHQSIDDVTYAYICDIATIPSARHNGYATFMLRHLFDVIYQQCNQIYGTTIHLIADANAVRLYESIGFVNTGVQYPSFTMAALHKEQSVTTSDITQASQQPTDADATSPTHTVQSNYNVSNYNVQNDNSVIPTHTVQEPVMSVSDALQPIQSPSQQPEFHISATAPPTTTQSTNNTTTEVLSPVISPNSIFSYLKQAVQAPAQALKRNVSDALSHTSHYKSISEQRRTQLLLKAQKLYRNKLQQSVNKSDHSNAANDYNTIHTIETELNKFVQQNRELQHQLDQKQDEYAELLSTLTTLQVALNENVALHTVDTLQDNVTDITANKLNSDTIQTYVQAELYQLQYNNAVQRNEQLIQRIATLYDENQRLYTIAERRQQRIATVSEEQSMLIQTLQQQLHNVIKKSERREQELIEEREVLTRNLKAMVDTLASENQQLKHRQPNQLNGVSHDTEHHQSLDHRSDNSVEHENRIDDSK